MAKCFFDTNVLVYSVDVRDSKKQAIARSLLESRARSGEAVLSTQVLQEFYVVATRKLGIAHLIAKAFAQQAAKSDVVEISSDLALAAMDLGALHQLSYWDALILSAAKVGKCVELYSEAMQDGLIVNGVKVVNPF